MALANRAECRALESFLDAYVDGEFESRETAEVEAHLSSCPGCSNRAAMQASYKEAVRRANAAPGAPVHLREQIRTALADPAAYDRLGLEDEASRQQPSGRWWTGPKGIATAAAVAGAAVWFMAGGLDRPVFSGRSRSPAPPMVEDGVALHARTLPLDFVSPDSNDVQKWLQGKVDFGVRLPKFEQAAAVQGVRLSTVHARQAAAVAYSVPRAESRRVTLLIVDDPDAKMTGVARRVADREVFVSHSRGFNVVSWRKDEIVYSLISDLDERDVLELVKTAQER